MKFKVGDKVRIRDLPVGNGHATADRYRRGVLFTENMQFLAGKVFPITSVQENRGVDYRLGGEAYNFYWTEDMLELVKPLNMKEELEQAKSTIEEQEKRIAELEEQLNIQKVEAESSKYIGKLVWCWDEDDDTKHIDIFLGHREDATYPYETQHSYYEQICPVTREEVLELIYEEE